MKKCSLFLIVGLFLNVGLLASQQNKIDSLAAALKRHPQQDTLQVRLLNELSFEMRGTDAKQSFNLAQQALRQARKLKFYKGEAVALRRIGGYYYQKADYANALRFYTLSKQVASYIRDSNSIAWAYNGLGTVYHSQSNYPQSLNHYLQAVQLFEKINRANDAASIMGNVGVLYKEMGVLTSALTYFEQGLKIHEKLGNKEETARFLNNIGGVYSDLGRYSEAVENYMRCLPIAEAGNYTHLIALILRNLLEAKTMQKEYAQALAYGLRSLSLYESLEQTEGIADVCHQLALPYLKTNKPDSALYFANRSLMLAQKIGFKRNIHNTYEVLAQVYADKKNYAEAYKAQRLQIAYKDSLIGEDKQNLVAGLKFQHELQKKQSQIELLTKEKQLQLEKADHQRQKMYVLFTGLVSTILLAVVLIRNNRQKQLANKLLLQQKAEIDEQSRRLHQLNNELKGTNEKLSLQTQTVTAQRDHLAKTLKELKAAQVQLIQREKMASLGELTAGIAHEIQNPLNFVNNFSDLNVDLLSEMKQELKTGNISEALLVAEDIQQNLQKISHHGKRADAIVKGMLQHSRMSTGQKDPTDVNALADEYLRLSYHGLKIKDDTFYATIQTDFDKSIGKINVIPQDIGRVLLNIYNNAFYSVLEKRRQQTDGYVPAVSVRTKKIEDKIEISVRDNGKGIPQRSFNKIFQPFFTTKPSGQGTGLGLSLSYDIITKGHGGELKVEAKEEEFAEFKIVLPA